MAKLLMNRNNADFLSHRIVLYIFIL